MKTDILDVIGEWNPQLYREIKGKSKPRNLIAAVTISLLIQGLCILPNSSYSSERIPQWEFEWMPIFNALNWFLPLALIIIGVYLLSSDLCREQQRGTLNFVRLSPQPSESILLGKLLGVPILLYLGVALALPLHFGAGVLMETRMSGLWIIANYIIWGALGSIFYGVATLLALMLNSENEGRRGLVGATSALALIFAPTAIGAIAHNNFFHHNGGYSDWTWYFLPKQLEYFWLLGTLFTLNHWIWQAANRRFRNPNQTLISKPQSYWIVAITHLWLLGFALPELLVNRENGGAVGVTCLMAIAPLSLLLMVALLSNPRQILLDWTRYRHWQGAKKRALLRDLLIGEKSPSLGAIAVHCAIIAVIWLPWVALFLSSPSFWNEIAHNDEFSNFTVFAVIIGGLMTGLMMGIYATIFQRIRFHARNKKHEIALSLLWTGIIFAPFMVAAASELASSEAPFLWLFTPVPLAGAAYTSIPTLLLGFLTQVALLGGLARQFQEQLQRAGTSKSKRLFEEAKVTQK